LNVHETSHMHAMCMKQGVCDFFLPKSKKNAVCGSPRRPRPYSIPNVDAGTILKKTQARGRCYNLKKIRKKSAF
jgi:hypothetical protein